MFEKRARRHDSKSEAPARAFAYARVSSKEQEKEGYSIPAQQKALKEYAARRGIQIVEEFVDIETAKQSGRTRFGEMVKRLANDRSIRIILVEKTDRLYRNMRDWVTVDDLDVEVHLVKENEVLSKNSRSSAKFMHGIKVVMAKNYVDNLSEEARKGMLEKAEQGVWPTKAPLGYANTTAEDGRKVIAVDLHIAPFIKTLFEEFSTGRHSLKSVAKFMHDKGFRYPKSLAKVPVSTIHTILRNRIYTGWFDWKGKTIRGKQEALVSIETWERVQDVLDGRKSSGRKMRKHDFAYSGLLNCGHCGCAMVGEIKKGKYVYYHCTGYRGKCPEPYVREEEVSAQFSSILGQFRFDNEILEWVKKALRDSHAVERREQQDAIDRLVSQEKRIQGRIEAMYLDKLDGRITADFFDTKSSEWRMEQQACIAEIQRLRSTDRSYIEDGVRILELAKNAQKLFDQQPPADKRRLLEFVVSNSTWRDGKLASTYRQPFDLIAETALRSECVEAKQGLETAKSEIWLGD
jgi:DNA invertase Pin-like site-specific DNA recombinase